VEDPRLVEFGDTYYLTYTGYNKKDAQLCWRLRKTLFNGAERGILCYKVSGMFAGRSLAIVPEKSAEHIGCIFLGTSRDNNDQMGLASSTDLLHWNRGDGRAMLPARAGMFDARVVERGLRRWLRRKDCSGLQRGGRQARLCTALPCSTGTIRGE